MNNQNLKTTIENITIPPEMPRTLLDNCLCAKHTDNFLFRYSKLAVAAVMAVILTALGSTSYAAYDLYQIKNLKVFFDSGISQEQIDTIGNELNSIPGIYSVRFVSAQEAWDSFQRDYLSELGDDVLASFTENPLKDSFNYDVIVELGADTSKIRSQIEQISGVRRVNDLKEEKAQQ